MYPFPKIGSYGIVTLLSLNNTHSPSFFTYTT